jgi:hypothetical protein
MLDDGAPSATTKEQAELEARVAEIYSAVVGGTVADDDPLLELRREAHVRFLHGGLGALPAGAPPPPPHSQALPR